MLLYLSSNENIGLFDFLIEEKGILIEKFSGDFSLKKFVIHDMRNLSHFSYIVIDLEAVNDPIQDIYEAIKAFKTMYDARIILLTGKTNIEFLNKLIDEANIYNIISGKTIEKIKDEIRICIENQGMSKHYAKMAINLSYDEQQEREYNVYVRRRINNNCQGFKDYRNIKIIVSGVMNRIGTTTAAMNLAAFLSDKKAKVSYTEGNGSNHLNMIHSYFFSNIPIINESFTDGKVDFYFNGNIPTDNYNFNIIDIGVLTVKNMKLTEIGDINILCAGTKPYELPFTNEKINLIKEPGKFIILFPSETEQKLHKVHRSQETNIYFKKYSPSLFDSSINSDIWGAILSEYLGVILS